MTPQLLLAWHHPSGSHVTRTVLTQIFLVMLPGVVPAAESPSLSWRTRQPASSCHLVGDTATGSHWCSALPPTHGPILGSGTLLSWVSGRQGGGRGPGVQGHPGSPCEAWPQQGQAEEATPILSCLSGPFLRTLNPVTQTVLRTWTVLRSPYQHYFSLLTHHSCAHFGRFLFLCTVNLIQL